MISLRGEETRICKTEQSGTGTAAGAASFMDDESFKTQMMKSDLILQLGSPVLTCVFF